MDDVEDLKRRLQAIVDELLVDARARSVLLVDKRGLIIASAGDELARDLDRGGLSALVAGHVAATGGVASLIEEDEFTGCYDAGEGVSIHMVIVGKRALLIVLFDKRTTLGLVRLRLGKIRPALATLLAAAFDEVTDDDFDRLFD